MTDLGAVVLCGGRSSRMGAPKAWLSFGDEMLLQRVIRVLTPVVGPIAVVAAPDQEVPMLPSSVNLVRDPVEGRGPLQGIAVGLDALRDEARYAYVSSTDAPFIAPEFVRTMRKLADGHDAAVLRAGGHHHPLSAIYGTHLADLARALLDADQRRPFFLFERSDTRFVDEETLLADPALRRSDPDLWSLRNLNTPEDYAQALADAELAEPR